MLELNQFVATTIHRDSASDVWTSVDVGSVRGIAGYLVPGTAFGKQIGLDSVQDVVDYLTLQPCFLLFDGCIFSNH